jgi:hypothetical protein
MHVWHSGWYDDGTIDVLLCKYQFDYNLAKSEPVRRTKHAYNLTVLRYCRLYEL